MNSEQQYIDLYLKAQELICRHSSPLMNSRRQEAFEAFRQSGFPGRQAERYKYTDVAHVFSPDYGLNLSRLDIPVNPYEVFRCDVPNLSTSLYFVLNDQFYDKALPKVQLPDGVIVSSLNKASVQHPELLERCYGRLARSGKESLWAKTPTLNCTNWRRPM